MSTAQAQISAFGLQPISFIALPAALLVLTNVTLALRAYVRGFMIKAWGLDDTVLVISNIFFLADAAIFIRIGSREAQYGLVPVIDEIISLALAGEMLYVATAILVKIALCLFVSRLITQRYQIWIIRASLGIYIIISLVFGFVCLFQCGLPKPINFLLDKCLDWAHIIGPLNYIFSISNAIVDWILTVIPILVIWKLQMRRREKMAATVLVLFGSIGSIVSVIRVPYVHGLKLTGNVNFFHLIIPEALCSIAETGVGITALSLAALRPLWSKMVEGSRSKTSGAKSSNWKSGGRTDGTGIRQQTEITVAEKRITVGGNVMVQEV